MKALILAGGDVFVTEVLKEQLKGIEFVIAADSGIRHAKELDLTPNLLVGDFDSITSEDMQLYSHVPIVRHQPEKDDLDLELAIEEVLKKGADELIFVGATGSRLDQSLAAIMIAARHKEVFKHVKLYTGKQTIEILQAGDAIELMNEVRRTFSLLSLVPESTLSIKNAKYPLSNTALKFGTGLGVSNETIAQEVTEVSIHSGLCVFIVELEENL